MKKIKSWLAYLKIWLSLYWMDLVGGVITVIFITLIVIAIVTGGKGK